MRTHVLPRAVRAILIGGTTVALVMIGAPVASADQVRAYVAELTGSEVVPGPGDPDGAGTATITIDRRAQTLCAVIHHENVVSEDPYAPIEAIVLLNFGPERVPDYPGAFALMLWNTWTLDADIEVCVAISPELIKQIEKDPSLFNVQINGGFYASGAISGRLTEAPKG
jgi:hypothetical protein